MKENTIHKIYYGFIGLLDLWILVLLFTPYSFRGKFLDTIVVFLGILLTLGAIYSKHKKRKKDQKKKNIYQSFIEWTVRVTLVIIVLPMLFYVTVMVLSDIINYSLLEVVPSSSGNRQVLVYFQVLPQSEYEEEVVAQLTFQLESKYFPLIEKQIYASSHRFEGQDPPFYVEWGGDDRLTFFDGATLAL